MYEERPIRSIVKAVSWRMTGTVDTMLISYLITSSFVMAASIGSVELITKMLLYYGHERVWNKISLGLKVKKI